MLGKKRACLSCLSAAIRCNNRAKFDYTRFNQSDTLIKNQVSLLANRSSTAWLWVLLGGAVIFSTPAQFLKVFKLDRCVLPPIIKKDTTKNLQR